MWSLVGRDVKIGNIDVEVIGIQIFKFTELDGIIQGMSVDRERDLGLLF